MNLYSLVIGQVVDYTQGKVLGWFVLSYGARHLVLRGNFDLRWKTVSCGQLTPLTDNAVVRLSHNFGPLPSWRPSALLLSSGIENGMPSGRGTYEPSSNNPTISIGRCGFLNGSYQLSRRNQILMAGQPYTVSLQLQMPESPINRLVAA